jgi:SAM-dependent methyltransferase
VLKNKTECPACHHHLAHEFSRDLLRSYLECESCSLVYVPRDLLVSGADEKKRYEAHENNECDPKYRSYLMNLVELIVPDLKLGDQGLDFGSGKSTLLSSLFKEHGFQVNSYDLYFHPSSEMLEEKYDFIILSEVIEHLRDPLQCMNQLKSLLKPSGKFFIKTKFCPADKASFDNWFYKRDITHVQFFNDSSFEKLLGPFTKLGEDVYRYLHID